MLSSRGFGPVSPDRWVVAATHPHREQLALENLARQGFRAYCPMIRKRIRHAQRTRIALRPLFPSYVFIGLNQDSHRAQCIHSTLGVRAVIRFGDRFGQVDAGFIEGLKAREVDGAIVAPVSTYKVGQTVRMVDGAFDGLIARIVETDEKSRLVVLMEFLNRAVRVRVDEIQVAAI
ncbi:MAG: transcription termination/antitermination NusG family protein [Hyphomicrobium sp.]